MRTAAFLAILTLGGLSVAAIGAGQTPQTDPVAAQPRQQAPSSQSGYVLKVRTRLVTLDVIATDSQGNVVRDGKVVTVDLKGARPQYSGDLPVDPTAQAFFDRVWQLTQCQAP